VFEYKVLRTILGPKREELAGGWRRLHNDKLHNLWASKNTVRAMKPRRMIGGTCSTCGRNKKCIQETTRKT
jgi:hypothetical protein